MTGKIFQISKLLFSTSYTYIEEYCTLCAVAIILSFSILCRSKNSKPFDYRDKMLKPNTKPRLYDEINSFLFVYRTRVPHIRQFETKEESNAVAPSVAQISSKRRPRQRDRFWNCAGSRQINSRDKEGSGIHGFRGKNQCCKLSSETNQRRDEIKERR